jgi:DNA polymerase-4
MDLLRNSAPRVQQISIDEAFLDVSDDPRAGEDVARALQKRIRKDFSLPTSWGVASNKLVAKIACEIGKPNGLVVVPEGEERAFLAPLPVQALWGVGPKAQGRLAKVGITTIGDISSMDPKEVQSRFGDWGTDLANKANGIDHSPVHEEHLPKSISHERTFARDISEIGELMHTLLQLSEWVGRRLRKSGLIGRTVKLKLRWPDFKTITRQVSLAQGTDQDGEIFEAAQGLFDREWEQGEAVRLLGVGVTDLGPPRRQLELFDRTWEESDRLLHAVDEIRRRFGTDALRRGGDLSKDE